MMNRLLVLGDIHGANKALLQVLERSSFDMENDRLVFIGDVADGWPETREAIDTLLTIPGLIHLLGNHDEWFRDWVLSGKHKYVWTSQGGAATIRSYSGDRSFVPENHRTYLQEAKGWHQEVNRMFVHAGWNYRLVDHPKDDELENLIWDRELWNDALQKQRYSGLIEKVSITIFDEVFVGHTHTSRFSEQPVQACEIWNVDQGASYRGRLTIMDVDTKEYWQSDPVPDLYPGQEGR